MTLYADIEHKVSHTKEGSFYRDGNDLTMMQRQQEKLMWERPMFHQDRTADYQPGRLSYDMKRIRAEETVGFGKRRQADTRKFKHEFPERIKEMNLRIKQEEEERLMRDKGPKMRARWWWKKTAVEMRDPLKMMRLNNFTFKPEELMTAKDIVFLQLTGCRLGDDAMSWVSAFMQQSYTLKRISLQANQITQEGCNEIFLGLRTTKTLMEFDISMNPIGDDGCATICNALNENSRWSKVYTVNMSCCKLSPNASFHLARLIRDFKPLQALLVWRNNLGCMTPMKVGGVAQILEELRSTTTMKLINLTCNVISDSDAAAHANFREIEMRRRSTVESSKKTLQDRVEELSKTIRVKRREAVWDDQRVEIASMEKELNETKSKLRVTASLEARTRTKAQKEEMGYQDRVRKSCGGEELVTTYTRPRLILTGNHSIRRMTLVRLSAFYDLATAPDAEEFVMRRRRFDNIITSRREIRQEYSGLRDHDQYDEHNVFKWDVSFDPKSDHARRTIVLNWREETRIKALSAVAVKFDKFSLNAPTEVPLGKDGKPLQMRSGGVGIASGVGDNIRDEKAGDRLAKKKEDLKIRQEESAKARIKKKVTVEQQVEVEVVRMGKDGKIKSSTKTVDSNQIKGNEESEVSVADFKKLEATLDGGGTANTVKNTTQSSSSTTTTSATKKSTTKNNDASAAGGVDDDDFPEDPKEEETLPAPRVASSSKMGGRNEEPEQEDHNDAEGFDFDAYEDEDAEAENDMLTQLLGRQVEEKSEHEKMVERNEAKMEELKAKITRKFNTPRTEGSMRMGKPVVASAADVTENMGIGSSGFGGSSARFGKSGSSSNVSTPRNSVASPLSPLVARRASVAHSVMAMVETSEAHASPDVPPLLVNPHSSGSEAEAGAAETKKVMELLETITKIKSNVQTLSEKGSPSDDDLAKLEKEKVRLGGTKNSAASTISGFTTPAIIGPGDLNIFWDFIDELIRETDIPEGNPELFASLLLKVATDYPTLIEERSLAAMAAADSSIAYLKLMLAVPDLRLDVVDLVSSCFFNQSARIPLSLLILSQPESVVPLEAAAEELSFMWQEVFEDIASKKRSIPREDRTGRMELLEIMIKSPHFPALDLEIEGGDGQSCVFRACSEGDFDLLNLMLTHKTIREPNAAKAAGMSLLHAAVIGNDVNTLKLLLEKIPSIDLTLKSENGNAMDLAVNLGREADIVTFLASKGVKASGGAAATKVKAAPKKVGGKKKPIGVSAVSAKKPAKK